MNDFIEATVGSASLRDVAVAALDVLIVYYVIYRVLLTIKGTRAAQMVIGLVLLDFPGKYKLERWLVTRRPVRRSIAWLRRRAGREPLVLEGER